MDVSLEGHKDSLSVLPSQADSTRKSTKPSKTKKDAVVTVLDFMKQNPTAKIIYIVDTHSMDNGFLAYTGNTPSEYMACSLREVSIYAHTICLA